MTVTQRFREPRFLLLASAVVVLHTAVTVFEESIFSIPGFHFGALLNGLCMATMFALASGLRAVQQVQLGGPSPLACAVGELRRLASSHPAHRGLAIVFGCFALTMVISKASLVYVSIPLQVVVKSCKILPVMAAGKFITGKVYSREEYTAATLLVSGVALFSLAGGNASAASGDLAPSSAVAFGVAMLLISLCSDALLGNWQERTMHEAAISPAVLLLCQTAFAALASLAIAAVMGELGPGLAMMRRSPHAAALSAQVLGYSTAMLGGTSAVLAIVDEYGAAAAVFVTLLRKCFSMFASYVLFPKPLTVMHLAGAALVLGAPYIAGKPSKRGPPPREDDAEQQRA